MAKARPKTGEKRLAKRDLKIDRLPIEVRDEIQQLKAKGRTWQEIEELSSLPRDKGGFIDWESLPTPVLELFPDLRLPHTSLHRWYDLRVEQVISETMARASVAREVAEAFAKSTVAHADEAVLNAARDQIMSVLAEDATPKGRMAAAKTLIVLADVLQEARKNDIKERSVNVDERKIQLLEQREALARKRLEAETERASKKLAKGTLTQEDLDRLKQRTFGLAPVEKHA